MSHRCTEIRPESEIDRLLYDTFTNELRTGYVEIGDEKVCMPLTYKDIADRIENFVVRDSDIFLVTHPKSGTTWTQEMIWMIVNKLDYEGAKINISDRFPFLELQCIFDYRAIIPKYPDFKPPASLVDSVTHAENQPNTPRLIKTHLPWCVLPKALRDGTTKARIVYVARNPKDTCISYYHHGKIVENFAGNLEQFCKLFLAGRLHSGPYWTSILECWERRNDPNILFLKYEDMQKDLIPVLKTLSNFLINCQFTDEQLSKLSEHLSFKNMKDNPSINHEDSVTRNWRFIKDPVKGKFMRNGKVGSYKEEMSEEIQKEFDKWIQEHTKNANITF